MSKTLALQYVRGDGVSEFWFTHSAQLRALTIRKICDWPFKWYTFAHFYRLLQSSYGELGELNIFSADMKRGKTLNGKQVKKKKKVFVGLLSKILHLQPDELSCLMCACVSLRVCTCVAMASSFDRPLLLILERRLPSESSRLAESNM